MHTRLHTHLRSGVSRILAAGLAALVLAAAPATAAEPPAADAAGTEAAGAEAAATEAAGPGVVIDEFTPAGPWGSDDEYVELRNTSASDVFLSNWELSICDPPDPDPSLAVQLPSVSRLRPGERMLLAGDGFPYWWLVDFAYASDVPVDGGWVLTDRDGNYVDGVGLTQNGCVETAPAPPCLWGAGMSVARDEDGTDLDNNLVDFTCGNRTAGE